MVVCSLYLFPIALQALPSFNSKMLLAVFGMVIFAYEHGFHRRPTIRKDMVVVLALSLIFSLSSYFSVVYNNTDDLVFATYFVKMSVWLGGAYTVIYALRKRYGEVTFEIVIAYLGLVCAFQCLAAIIIDNSPTFSHFLDTTFIEMSQKYFEEHPRLYGIGASFDTAGIRFSCVLLGLAYLIKKAWSSFHRKFFILLFLIVGILGNLIARTTVVGVIIACLYILLSLREWIKARITAHGILWFITACCLLAGAAFAARYQYDRSQGFREAFDYGFEGFQNLYDEGSFSTHSSDLLLDNIFAVTPNNAKTWLIGDGYFADPINPEKFYMGTDMGYIRFIFYCGLVGLFFFIFFFISCTYVLCRREQDMKVFFFCLLVVQLVVWVKIPTDIFCFYALLLLSDGHIRQTSGEEKYSLNIL